MGYRLRDCVLTAALAGLGAGALFGQQAADSLPDGVTATMVAAGKKYFQGEGLCAACHGMDGKGNVGPNLTDKVWLHGTGHFPEIERRVLSGVAIDSSKSGQIMPPRGGSQLTDEQVRAVAAYVWTLSRPAKKK